MTRNADMIISTIQPSNEIHEHLQFKYVNTDLLDMIVSKRCKPENCQQSEFSIWCPNCSLTNIKNLNYYLKNALQAQKLYTVDYKSHFRRPCFYCSSNFHGSNFEDGLFNLQKIFKIEEQCCNTCRKNYTTERLFYHNCNLCNSSFKNCQLLLDHSRRSHNSKKPHQCAACNLSLSNYTTLKRHIGRHKLPYNCSYCNRRYATKVNLKLHIISHTGEKPYSCKHCPKKFITKRSLDCHLFEHTGGKKFKCDSCDKTFARQFSFNRHKLIHMENPLNMEKSFQCKYCPKKYKRKDTLNLHLFEHKGGKEFNCSFCNKTFAKKFLLNIHKSVHMEKSFQCEHCPKQYKSKRYLDIHVYEHVGGKLFKCDLCDKTFAAQRFLNKHKPSHTEKSVQCTICSKFYTTHAVLRWHIKTVHKL